MSQETKERPVFSVRLGLQPLYMAGASGISQIALAVIYVIAARDVGPVQFGHVIAAIAMGNVAAGLIDFGSNSLWTRNRAKGALPNDSLGSMLISKVIFTACLMAVLFIVAVALTPSKPYWMAAPIAFAVVFHQALQVPLKGLGRSDRVAVAIAVERVSALVIILLLMMAGNQPATVLWAALFAGSILAALMSLLLTPASARPTLRGTWSNPWAGARNFGLAGWAVAVQGLDVPLMGAVGGALQAGLYGAVSRWTQPMGLLAAAYTSAAAPFVARSKNFTEAWRLIRGSAWVLLLAIILCVGVFFFADLIVITLVGESFASSAFVLQLLAIGTIPAVMCQPLSVFLQQMGHDLAVSRVVISTVLIQLILVGVLGAWTGAIGGAQAYVIVQCLTLISLSVVAIAAHKRKTKAKGN